MGDIPLISGRAEIEMTACHVFSSDLSELAASDSDAELAATYSVSTGLFPRENVDVTQ